jgi:polar amino acid transport system permease protein
VTVTPAQVSPGGTGRRVSTAPRAPLVTPLVLLVMAAGASALAVVAASTFTESLGVEGLARTLWVTGVWVLAAAGVASVLVPAVRGLERTLRSRRLRAAGNHDAARIAATEARDLSWWTGGMALTVAIVAFLVWFLSIDAGIIRRTFLDGDLLWNSLTLSEIRKGFWLNVKLFVTAEILVLFFGLVIALIRMFPGRPGKPLRFLAIAYTDVFRGFPAIVVIYLFVLGMQTAGLPELIPVFSGFSRADKLFWLGVMALTLVYSAYVAEVYRSGLDGVHWSQTAGARSLGLSWIQTMRHVVVPQAVRRIMPPLLNDFIGLQKDTALLSVIGFLEVLGRTRIIANNQFNLSPIVGAGIAFLVITIPLARLTDWLIKRDQERMRAGGG